MKKQFFALFFVCLLFFIPTSTFAARSVSITSDKNSLFSDEELTLSASMSGFAEGETIYLKGAFFKEGSTNYFGYTKNGDSWIKNSTTATEQRAIQIGNFDGVVIVRSDFDDSGYSGSGDYSLKLGFYYITSGGNVSSVNWSSNILSVLLEAPTPTVETTQSFESPATVPAQATKAPTVAKTTSLKTPTPSKNLPTATKAQKSVNSAKITQGVKISSQQAKLKVIQTPTPSSKEVKVLGAKDNNLPAFMIIGGLFLLVAGGSFVGLKIMKEKGLYENLFNK